MGNNFRSTTITIDGDIKNYNKGDSISIPLQSKHRVENKNNSM